MAAQGYSFSGVPDVGVSPDLAIRSGGFSFGDDTGSQSSGSGIFAGLDNFLSTGLSFGSPASGAASNSAAPAYSSGYNVTGGVVSGPSQVSTSQIDGSANWQNAMKAGLSGIFSMIGATGDTTAQPTVQPASYTTASGASGTSWGVVLFLVAGAGLAIYAASK